MDDMEALNESFERIEDDREKLKEAGAKMKGSIADSGLVELMNLMPEGASTQTFEDEVRDLCMRVVDRSQEAADLPHYWKVTYIVRVPKGWEDWVRKRVTVGFVEPEYFTNHDRNPMEVDFDPEGGATVGGFRTKVEAEVPAQEGGGQGQAATSSGQMAMEVQGPPVPEAGAGGTMGQAGGETGLGGGRKAVKPAVGGGEKYDPGQAWKANVIDRDGVWWLQNEVGSQYVAPLYTMLQEDANRQVQVRIDKAAGSHVDGEGVGALMREDRYVGEFVLRNLEKYGGQGSHGTNAIVVNLMHSNEVRKRYYETKARMLVNAAMTGNWPEGAPGPRNAARSIGLLLDRYGLDHGATGKLMNCTFRQLEDVMGKYEPREPENDKGEVNAKLVTMLKWCRKEEGDVYWTESEVDFQEVWKEPGTGGRESRLHKRRRGTMERQANEEEELDRVRRQVDRRADLYAEQYARVERNYGEKRWQPGQYEEERIEEYVQSRYQDWTNREEECAYRYYEGTIWEGLSPTVRQHVRDVFVVEEFGNVEAMVRAIVKKAWQFENDRRWECRAQLRTEVHRREHVRRDYTKLSMEVCWAHTMRGGCAQGEWCRFCHIGRAQAAIY